MERENAAMQAAGVSEATKRNPPFGKTIRDPIAAQRDGGGVSAHGASQHSSLQEEGPNQVSLFSQTSQESIHMSYVALQSHRGDQQLCTEHISGEPNANVHSSSNPTVHLKSPHLRSLQMSHTSSRSLSPAPTKKAKVLKKMYLPPRLDSHLLSFPWSNSHPLPTMQSVPSPTRTCNGRSGAVHSYWNAASNPVPYPCGSPTAYSNGVRVISPSAQYFLQQQSLSMGDSSPIPLSISPSCRESSLIGGTSIAISPSVSGIAHSTILDAPLQASLVPPSNSDGYPHFCFGNSIMQSTPFTPVISTPSSRGHSIYLDTMMELSQHRQELDNPLSGLQTEGMRPLGHEYTPTNLARRNVSSASITSLMAEAAGQLHQVPPQSMNGAFLASCSGTIFPPQIVDGTPTGWVKLRQISPANTLSSGQPPGRSTTQLHGDDEGYAVEKQDTPQEAEAGETCNSRCSSTLDDPSSFIVENTAIFPSASPEEIASKLHIGGAGRTKFDRETNFNGTEPDAASGTEQSTVAVVAPSDSARIDDKMRSKAAVETSSTAPEAHGSTKEGLQLEVSPGVDSRRRNASQSTPGVSPPTTHVASSAPRRSLCTPSEDDGSCAPPPLRDGLTRHSPSERSTSTLSLVPNIGVMPATPTLFSVWRPVCMTPSTAPNVCEAFNDLLESLRALQSDIAKVHSRVSLNEHTARHWIGCSLNALLHLTVEVSHSAYLSAIEEPAENEVKPERGLTYAQLRVEIQSGAAGCVEGLHNTIPVAQNGCDILEPLLLTSMLARGAITSLLWSLEQAYAQCGPQPTAANGTAALKQSDVHDAAAAAATNRRAAYVTVPLPAPLTAERIDELMDSDALANELGGEWRQFTSDYNRTLFRYVFLRVLYAQLSRKNGSEGSGGANNAADGTYQHRSSAANTNGSTETTLHTIASAWVDHQVKQWSFIFQQDAFMENCNDAVIRENLPEVDEAGIQLLREAFCRDFPSYEVVCKVFSSFREGECWQRWYTLLGQMMESAFYVQGNTALLDYATEWFTKAPSPSASAALQAISAGQITLEQVGEALATVETSLGLMEEEGRARRVTILQLLLRRIFVLGVVSSVHRNLGKDAVLSDAQLATYVQVQRKSLDEVEAQLTSEHAEGKNLIKCIRAFLSLFSDKSTCTFKAGVAGFGEAAATRIVDGNAIPSVSSPHLQWNTSTVEPLASLLEDARPHIGSSERSTNEDTQKWTRDALSLIHDVSTSTIGAIKSLCALFQTGVDVTEAKRDYSVAPTNIPIHSTRALSHLQASLTETHRTAMVCLASLHLDY
ncbi:hypothetical protein ABL78_3425 [Leptomonas seymouri]|uniref:Uncharacterized protein n=1 Tax=Leptomonas seymouri TaxID=5684 RepID=A0A0N0P6C5_LEPSE|nr:hypothetical protein ABL78_3425 [Leptomonas seymouri]|eukprot:KPI87476.1 hypothetical protein ABL78_3425 [Leptomonas seymouri]